MAQVPQVVRNKKLQACIATGRLPHVPGGARVCVPHHMRQVAIICQPQFHQLAPLASGIILRAHPIIPVIRGQYQAIFELQTHEPLIIPNYQEWTGRSSNYTQSTVRSVMAAPCSRVGR